MSQRPVPRRDIPDRLRVRPGSRLKLVDADADRCFGWEKDKAVAATSENVARLEELQYKMYADGRFAMLIALQAIDGGGKDSTIRRVFGAFNPQGCTVTAFKAPSAKELRHDYLWRVHRHAPPKGEIAVFNRSHYEDVLIVRVNDLVPEDVWSSRYQQINDFERLLDACGTRVVKMAMFARCSTDHAPWYVVPANRKWFRDFAVSQLLLYEFEQLPLRFPAANFDPKTIKLV
jgi:polyphosphate kinase 2 (PPK2 family)